MARQDRERDRPDRPRRADSDIDMGVSINNRNYSQEDPGYEGYIGAADRNPLARWSGADEWTREGPGGAWRGGPGRGYDAPGFEDRAGGGGSFGSHFGRVPRSGRFAGRGPKNYRRSDERIREDVNERLTDHPEIDATDISVSVDAGVVVLAGTVEGRPMKHMAEDIAEAVSGVREVRNDLRVTRQGQS